jgi:hypothetical protein
MKMRKLFLFVAMALISVLFLSGCSPANGAAQWFVDLPGELELGITAVVLVAVSFGFAKLLSLVPFLAFLGEFREPLAYAIAVALIGWIEAAVPDAFANIAIISIQLVLAILAFFGVANVFKEQGIKGFK